MTKLYYRVKTGHRPDEFREIDGDDLEMCLRAQITGKVAFTKRGTISGNAILEIHPDWHRVLGLSRLHPLDSADMRELPREVHDSHLEALAAASQKAQEGVAALGAGQVKRLG